MSEHRRKPPQSQGGGRAAVRRGVTGSSGRRAAPRDATGSASGSYESPDSFAAGGEPPYEGRAAARRAAQRSASGGGRRRAAEGAGRGGAAGAAGGGRRGGGGPGGPGPGGPGRGRGRGAEPPGRPGKRRLIDYPRSGKAGWRKFVPSWKQVTGTFIGFCGLLMAAAGIAYAMVGMPKAQDVASAQTNVFYWSDGTQMAATGGEKNRQVVGIDRIPPDMRWSVVSAENATFYNDKGVDPMGIARAVVNMAKGGETQGGSTITQQFVKNTYLDQSQTLTRKARELFISIKVGAEMEKDDVLAGYLNSAYYGRNAYGIQAASQAYFGKDSEKLSMEESAFLAGVLKGPNLYSPDGGVGANATAKANTKRLKARWEWILDRRVETGNLTQAKRDKAGPFPKPIKQKSTLAGQTGYLVDTAKDYVATKLKIPAEELEKGGYRIYTTFDKNKVKEMEKAVQRTKKAFLDDKKRPKTDKNVQFGGASVDPKSGAIVALYGGNGFDEGHYTNNANTRGVPVGSTWKPYVLAAAMQDGTVKNDGQAISPESLYNGNDQLIINDQNGDPIKDAQGQPFRQKNESDRMWGKVTLRKAMEQSINTPFVQLGIDVGLSKTRDLAANTGILEESFDKGNLGNASFSLGTSTPSAIRMADSYGTFANEGAHFEPYSVTKVVKSENDQQEVLPGFEKPKRKSAMDANVANNITDVLQNVVKNGTGKKVADIGFPVAGKTGTTDKNKSAWFVGYTRELSTAVTLFRTDPKEGELLSMNGTGGVPSIHGGDIPAQIWKDYMEGAMKGVTPEAFPAAEEIGDIVGEAPSPSPSPTETADPEDSATPTPTGPNPSGSPSGEPSPGETCDPFDLKCKENGGTTDGGTDTGGADGGTTGGETTTPEPPSGGNGNGGGGGGWFGGPTG
ncbi:transglycosylase domain-containing protein [Streptomyces boluensis]|uniref:Penicillin-binding protein n=1 Tax=Streptomyces boluensis TaxID=1775135 RepID=A0A964UPC6_9ACTN|nr:transglycosylase domain-containing protein [Streptomyces boluensis]NBE52796.1 penicillin-binding protein [Streptomyces boluensis]